MVCDFKSAALESPIQPLLLLLTARSLTLSSRGAEDYTYSSALEAHELVAELIQTVRFPVWPHANDELL